METPRTPPITKTIYYNVPGPDILHDEQLQAPLQVGQWLRLGEALYCTTHVRLKDGIQHATLQRIRRCRWCQGLLDTPTLDMDRAWCTTMEQQCANPVAHGRALMQEGEAQIAKETQDV